MQTKPLMIELTKHRLISTEEAIGCAITNCLMFQAALQITLSFK